MPRDLLSNLGLDARLRSLNSVDGDDVPLASRLTLQSVSAEKLAADSLAADESTKAFRSAPCAFRIARAYVIPAAALTADDTDYADISVKVGSTVLATASTTTAGTGDWVANTAFDLTLSGVDVSAGDRIDLVIEKAGSGVVVPSLQVVLDVLEV